MLLPHLSQQVLTSSLTYDFAFTAPQTSWLLRKAAGIEKGSSRPGSETVGQVTMKQIYHIAEIKLAGVEGAKKTNLTLEAVARSVAGSCRSMGLKVVP